jgi:hypothetical protein
MNTQGVARMALQLAPGQYWMGDVSKLCDIIADEIDSGELGLLYNNLGMDKEVALWMLKGELIAFALKYRPAAQEPDNPLVPRGYENIVMFENVMHDRIQGNPSWHIQHPNSMSQSPQISKYGIRDPISIGLVSGSLIPEPEAYSYPEPGKIQDAKNLGVRFWVNEPCEAEICINGGACCIEIATRSRGLVARGSISNEQVKVS